MIYLLTIGWPWFVAALAVGLATGWLTRASRGEGSANWMLWAALLLLAGGAASVFQALPGRGGLTLDVAWLAGLAYFVGLPLGATARPEAAAPVAEPKKPPIVVLRGESIMQAPMATPELPVADVSGDAATLGEAPAAARPKNAYPGAEPARLEAPRGGVADDLLQIKGLGPKSVETLHALGVFHHDQIAAWSLDNAKWIGAALGGPGRVERGKWIQQAREIVAAGKSERPAASTKR